jgi:hypothetical protein
MNKLLTIAMTGIFVLTLQGPGQAQKETAPPISPLLEGQRPLEHVETKEPAAPQQPEPIKAKSGKSKKGAKVKKLAGKKRQAVASKKSQKASKKKRPAVTHRQAGPDEG